MTSTSPFTIALRTSAFATLAALALFACSPTHDDGADAGASDANVCLAGHRGCACQSDGTCPFDPGLRCRNAICVDKDACNPGEQDCPCDSRGGCLSGLSCNQTTTGKLCQPAACDVGKTGCPCKDSGVCDEAGALCDARSVCAIPSCPPGTEGCLCANGTCGTNSQGKRLVCQDNHCADNACAPGATGCVCRDAATCADASAACEQGYCVAKSCVPGIAGCPCNQGHCEPGAMCRDDAICIESRGQLGGACTPDGGCDDGLACGGGTCAPCTLGTTGCTCDAGDTCATGTKCVSGRCIDQSLAPPDVASCWTPCQRGIVGPDGVYRACPDDGLMQGCLSGRTCREGSCLADGDDAPVCASDIDCPDYQTCLQGKCYSNCNASSQCASGLQCYRHVCRTPCTSTGPACADGNYCDALDGTSGYCMPLAAPSATPAAVTPGTFGVAPNVIAFSNLNTVVTVVLSNASPTPVDLRVRKFEEIDRTGANAASILRDPDDATPCTVGTNCPLVWLEFFSNGTLTRNSEITVHVPANGSTNLRIGNANGGPAAGWTGTLEVVSRQMGTQHVQLSYAQRPDGQWTGTAWYYASFGDKGIYDYKNAAGALVDGWVKHRDDVAYQSAVANALVQRWGAFRGGRISWDEFQAVMTSSETGSWNWAGVKNACHFQACYPYDQGAAGVGEYSSDLASIPVPSGGTELPIAINFHQTDPTKPTIFSGRVETSKSLQYSGNPALSLAFDKDTSQCSRNAFGACLDFVNTFQFTTVVGARYDAAQSDATCAQVTPASALQQVQVPWLVPGFQRNVVLDPATGLGSRYECRDSRLPLNGTDDLTHALNAQAARANPIPDGRTRTRTISMLDGVLVNNQVLVILFAEQFDSFLAPGNPNEAIKAYGYMVLRRTPVTPPDTDTTPANGIPDIYEGNTPTQSAAPAAGANLLAPVCSDTLMSYVGGGTLDQTKAATLVRLMVDGVTSSTTATIGTASTEEVHYLCGDTGVFDYGGDPATRKPCPDASEITFFTVDKTKTCGTTCASAQSKIDALACNQNGSCGPLLDAWRAGGGPLVQVNPSWKCTTGVYCSFDRLDLRNGKTFYAQAASKLPGLRAEIDQAFRYKTRFQNREGTGLAFTPSTCDDSGADAVPYCYDPAQIEALRDRVECLVSIWNAFYTPLKSANAPEAAQIEDSLRFVFSYDTDTQGVVHDGFERLYAELLVMLGDEAYTQAFQSRFDLAASRQASFQGTLFEVGGIDLSGVTGAEMFNLYQATQYYEESLGQFYRLSQQVWKALNPTTTPNYDFVTQATVTSYFDRLIHASTQKARAFSEIAQKYQALDKPELARRVIERAYTATYLEGIVLSRLMLRITDALKPEDRPQILQQLGDTQITYRMALLDMRNAYQSISDQTEIFGFPPDYIPFPALDSTSDNAFNVVAARAQDRVALAKVREDLALAQSRSYDTDSASFQAQLVQLRTTYENQLAQLCGTMQGTDGNVYPAISKYAELNDRARALGDPCGLMGVGDLNDAIAQVSVATIGIQEVMQQISNINQQVSIEQQRVAQICNVVLDTAKFVYQEQEQQADLQSDIRTYELGVQAIQGAVQIGDALAQAGNCQLEQCPGSMAAAAATATIDSAGLAGTLFLQTQINDMQTQIASIDRTTAYWQTASQCDQAVIDSNATTANLLLGLKQQQLELLRARYNLELAISTVQKLQMQEKRIALEQSQAEQLAINVEAAQNDPNVRIYKNDAVLNADITFQAALTEVYRATRVFEYYTSQSYPDREKLFLIRMVGAGDYNLENYLLDLETAFENFQETYGNPDQRVAVLSLRDDILAIPRLDANGAALSQDARIQQMVAALQDPARIDEHGYITIPFDTSLDELSPLTRNHKILYMEAEISGSRLGDSVGRLYVTQSGTGTVRELGDGDKQFFRFPDRTAVINPFFNGTRTFSNPGAANVYGNFRFRDRPFANTSWTLQINQRDESVNQDIDLSSLSDIRLFIYYTDFTEF